MQWSFIFFFNSCLLGVGLAMDAFSVSLANGLNETDMSKKRMCMIAGVFAVFQILMPLIGWVCVHTVVQYFKTFEKFIPWIALILLVYIGGKMIYESRHPQEDESSGHKVTVKALMIQGIATSIDALSVGFTISDYNALMAFAASLLIGIVTFVICMAGLFLGKKFGTSLSGKASFLGGVILIGIGLEIFIRGIL